VRGNPDATVSTPVSWDEVADVDPRDFPIGTVPARYAKLGDLHAGIDEAVFDIAPLLKWAERDEAEGAEVPPEPDPDADAEPDAKP
jgi:DNA primase